LKEKCLNGEGTELIGPTQTHLLALHEMVCYIFQTINNVFHDIGIVHLIYLIRLGSSLILEIAEVHFFRAIFPLIFSFYGYCPNTNYLFTDNYVHHHKYNSVGIVSVIAFSY